METTKDFRVDQRVGIALDALTAEEQALVRDVIRDKRGFLASASDRGKIRELSLAKSIYELKVSPELRLIFCRSDDDICILDLMRKATLDRFEAPRSGRLNSPT